MRYRLPESHVYAVTGYLRARVYAVTGYLRARVYAVTGKVMSWSNVSSWLFGFAINAEPLIENRSGDVIGVCNVPVSSLSLP